MTERQRNRLLRKYPQLFDAATERLLNSPNLDERRTLFHGFSVEGEHPIVFPRDRLFTHGHMWGDPGAGKSAKGIAPLSSQLIGSGEASIITIDAKGDLSLFHNAREEAFRAGLPFKFFTNRVGWSSYLWNVMRERYLGSLSNAQKAEHILSGLGLSYGDAYGASFYSATQRLFLLAILERYADSISSLRDLHRFCADPAAYKGLGPKSDWLNSRHLIAELKSLSGLLPLNATGKELPDHPGAIANAISVEEVLRRPTVIYIALQSTVDGSQATMIGRLFLMSLLAAAAIYRPEGAPIDVFIFIDEAQQFATRGLPLFLNQARNLRLACILSHQSLDQLKISSESDLTNVVVSATGFKQVFRSSDLVSRDYLLKTGGEAVYHKLAWAQPVRVRNGEPDEQDICPSNAPIEGWSGLPVVNVQEEIRPRLEPNTIMQVSSDAALSLVNFTEDGGMVQYGSAWTPVISGFHIDAETYRRRMNTPWPAVSDSTVVVPREWQPGGPPPASGKGRTSNDLNRRIQGRLDQSNQDSDG